MKIIPSEVGLSLGVDAVTRDPVPHDFWGGFCLKCVGELADAAEES